MNDNRVITEVARALRAIGTLGERLEEGRVDIDLAITTAAGLLARACADGKARIVPEDEQSGSSGEVG